MATLKPLSHHADNRVNALNPLVLGPLNASAAEEKELSLLPLFAVTLPIIILFCGLSVDVGLLEIKKLQMQTAADAAAIGAELEWERSNGNQTAQGKADATANGFTDGVNNVTISISNPAPASGDFANRYDVQYVTITQTVNTIFMGTLNGGTATVSVTAVAMQPTCGYLTNTAGIANLYTLSISNLLFITGGQGMYSRCPVYIKPNVSMGPNMYWYQNATDMNGTAIQSLYTGGGYGPPPLYNSPTVPDPLASVVAPIPLTCDYNHFSYTTLGGYTTLNPGTYCGSTTLPGMTLAGNLSGGIYFNPGVYIITGGFHATGVYLSGSGVTLYFTHGAGGVPYRQVIFDGASRIHFRAPTVGSFATIMFFTDRNWVHTAAQDFQLNDAEFDGDGIWYVTGTGVQLTAASATYPTDFLGIVTDSFVLESSTMNLSSDFSAVTTGNPFRTKSVLVQ